MDLTGNAALVTGASGGIGEEFAVQLAAHQVNLVLAARRAGKLDGVRATLLDRRPGLSLVDLTAWFVPTAAAKRPPADGTSPIRSDHDQP